MKKNPLHICIVGAAGQGIATIGGLIGKACVRQGHALHCSQAYESRIRGGVNAFSLRIGTERALAPVEEIDLLVALNEQSLSQYLHHLSPSGLVVSDDSIPPASNHHCRVPLKEMGTKAHLNTVLGGALAALLGLDQTAARETLAQILGGLAPDALEDNQRVFTTARDWTLANMDRRKETGTALPTASSPASPAAMMTGNEAVALGALAAGLKFFSFYPMSPATSISLAVADAAERMGVVLEQVEDEIAAVAMALGASFAGAKSMTATSGGGMALMCESVSLAGMTETPLVIAVAMRPGPATGLPTRTEQGDLDLVLHAGHGDFPRAIFAPGSLQECFDAARQAFAVAEEYQTPVFVLTDQYLADSYRDTPLFALPSQPESACPSNDEQEKEAENYERYAFSESGVSPRRVPGFSKALVVADSDEHTPDGHITEDLTIRVRMQDKRMAKLEGMRQQALAPNWTGDEAPDLLLVCWGSSSGAALEAARILTGQGKKTAVCHFVQVYPLRGEDFLPAFAKAKKVIVVESNYTGQFTALLQKETGFAVHGKALRYDGLPMTANYILATLESASL